MSIQTRAPSHSSSHEPDAHSAASHFRTGARLLLDLALIETVGCMCRLPDAAYFAAKRLEPGKTGMVGEDKKVGMGTVVIVTGPRILGELATSSWQRRSSSGELPESQLLLSFFFRS